VKKNNNKIITPFVIFSLVGGIGDQIFILAFARTIMKKLKCKLVLDISYYDNKVNYNNFKSLINFLPFNKNIFYKKKIFKFDFKFLTYIRFLNVIKNFFFYKFLMKKLFKLEVNNFFFENTKNIKKIDTNDFSRNDYYYGYWHNLNLIQKEKNYFRKELIDQIIKKKNIKNFIKHKISSKTVAVHIRGGDFKNVKSHSLLGISYYENAIKTIKTKTDNPIFHIYTNDMKFAKKIFKNLKLNNKIFFVNSENFNDIEEFCLYSQYKFSIIANSTFSLMSSFLSNKRIISIGPKNNWEHNSELKKEKRFKKLILV
jgi:hypothetical protein